MLWIFYDFVIHLMALAARLGGTFSGKLQLRNQGLRDQKVPSLKNSIWIHAASLGEFEQGKSIIDGQSEEHTSELQSRGHLVCRLLLEKKKNKYKRRSN